MTRYTKNASGYMIQGKRYEILEGSRAQVWHGTAYKTSGGLTKTDLLMNKAGRVVSKSKYLSAKREKRLQKAGFFTQKGKFGFVRRGSTRRRRGRSAKRGGGLPALSPAPISDIKQTSGADLQLMTTNY
jgi:DVNP family